MLQHHGDVKFCNINIMMQCNSARMRIASCKSAYCNDRIPASWSQSRCQPLFNFYTDGVSHGTLMLAMMHLNIESIGEKKLFFAPESVKHAQQPCYLSLRSWCSLFNRCCSLSAMLFTGPINTASLLITSSLLQTVTCSRSPNSSSSSGEMLVKLSVPVASAAQLSVMVARHAASNVRSNPALCHNQHFYNMDPSEISSAGLLPHYPCLRLRINWLSASDEDGGP